MLSAVMGEPAESGAAGDASNAIAAMRFASLLRAREIGGTPIRRYRLKRGEERSRLQARRYQRTSATRERPWRTRLAILSAKDSADEAVSRAVRSCALLSSCSLKAADAWYACASTSSSEYPDYLNNCQFDNGPALSVIHFLIRYAGSPKCCGLSF